MSRIIAGAAGGHPLTSVATDATRPTTDRVKEALATALKNVVPSHLADQRLFDFVGLTQNTVVEEGDTAFDPPELPDRTLGASVTLFRAGDQSERECA